MILLSLMVFIFRSYIINDLDVVIVILPSVFQFLFELGQL